MDGLRLIRGFASKQSGRDKGAFCGIRINQHRHVTCAKNTLGLGPDLGGLFQHIAPLRQRYQGTHACIRMAGIADGGICQLFDQCRLNRVQQMIWHHDTAHGGTFLARLHRDFAVHLFHEEIKFGRPHGHISTKNRGIQTVLFRHKMHRVLD